MKKFFTSLLALVGMVAGFTLTSCGGGGGGGDSNLTGLQVSTAGTTPTFTLRFEEKYAPQLNMYTCSYVLGRAMTTGSFAMEKLPRREGNQVVIEGSMGFIDGEWLIRESNATFFFGLRGDSDEGCSVTELKVTIRFDEDGNGTMEFDGKGYGFSNGSPLSDTETDPETDEVRNVPQKIDKDYSIGITEGAKRFHSGVGAQ